MSCGEICRNPLPSENASQWYFRQSISYISFLQLLFSWERLINLITSSTATLIAHLQLGGAFLTCTAY